MHSAIIDAEKVHYSNGVGGATVMVGGVTRGSSEVRLSYGVNVMLQNIILPVHQGAKATRKYEAILILIQ